jgi:hypothetical protein
MPRGRPGRIRATALPAALAVALAAACGGGGDGDDAGGGAGPSGTTAASSTAPPTTVDERTQKEEAAKAAFLAYYDAFFEAVAEPVNPQLPKLQRLMTGEQRQAVTRNLEDMQARGHATRLPPNSKRGHDPKVVELQPDGSVHITSCEIDDSIVYDIDTGAVINDDVVTNVIAATLIEEHGRWKVTFSERAKRSQGIVECDI